jgi:CRISPR-associated exonuclease Cas4
VLTLSIISIIIALVLFYLAFRLRKKTGIPTGHVIYTDTSQWMIVEKPLYDRELGLAGKPDYLVRQGQQVIPIEVKSRQAPNKPPAWHISQLAAYCLLVEKEYGNRPAHGILHYADRTLAVDFTSVLEDSTRHIIQEMQANASQLRVERSHHDQHRCMHCSYRSMCDQALRI